MTAISKSYVIPTDAATDADSPIDQALMQGLRDCIIFVKEWLGESFTAGAVQDHNHDGVNSALVEIGPNAIRNGSFESDEQGWTISDYTGGSHAINTANDMDGAKCLAFTSTSTANGGGVAVNGEYRSCTGLALIYLKAAIKASVANVSSRIRVIWYDDAQAQISTTDFYTSTSTPTTQTNAGGVVSVPASARFYRIELVGGVPGSGSATGTIYFDGVEAAPVMLDAYGYASVATTSGTSQTITGIPAHINELDIFGVGISLNAGGEGVHLRIGDAGGVETTGYSANLDTDTTRVSLGLLASAGDVANFYVKARRTPGTNTWDFTGWRTLTVSGTATFVSGRKTLSETLDRVSVIATGGASLDAGSMLAAWRA